VHRKRAKGSMADVLRCLAPYASRSASIFRHHDLASEKNSPISFGFDHSRIDPFQEETHAFQHHLRRVHSGFHAKWDFTGDRKKETIGGAEP